jgi:hypothetical protein
MKSCTENRGYSCIIAPVLMLCQLQIKYNDNHFQNKTVKNME